MRKVANWFWHDKTGMAAVEYALLLGFVAATIAVAMSGLGTAVIGALTAACTNVGGPC
jgi:Flp pilus assembly pilin Flp